MSSYLGTLRKQGILPQIAAVILGASSCSVIGFWMVTEVALLNFLASLLLILSYALFAVFYSVGASLMFQPKRFVSPTYIQLVTVPIMVVIVLDTIYRGLHVTDWASFVTLYMITLSVMLFFLFVLAYALLSPIARYLVGLSGTKEDLWVTQYLVHSHCTKVLAELTDHDFQFAIGITEQEEIRHDIWLFRTPADILQPMYVVVCPNPENRKLTQVVIVSYELAEYGIAPTTRARAMHELDAKSIRDRLQKLKVVEIRQEKTKLLPALTVAYENALARTEPKILTIAKLPTRHKAVIVCTALILIVIGILGYLGKIGPDLTESAILFVGIAMVFEFLPLVAVKRGSRAF